MKILWVELNRTWNYLRKTKYVDNVSWTRKNLNLPTTGEKKWRYSDLNKKELEPTSGKQNM